MTYENEELEAIPVTFAYKPRAHLADRDRLDYLLRSMVLRCRSARRAADITQAEFGKMAGVSTATISAVERFHRWPSAHALAGMLDAAERLEGSGNDSAEDNQDDRATDAPRATSLDGVGRDGARARCARTTGRRR